MAQLQNIYNLVACGLTAILGTGLKGCKPFFKKVTTIWLTPAGFKFDGTQVLDETYVQLLQAQGNLVVINGIRTFTSNTGEDVIDELEDGTKQVARLALYEFMIKFINGLYFNSALNSLNSFGAWDVTLIDRDGNILGTKASDGSLKGFTLGMFQTAPFEWATDSQGQREGVSMQMLERSEFDTDYVFIQSKSNNNYNPNRTGGVNEVVLEFTVAPANLATTLTVKATRKQDSGVFTGIDYTDFILKVDGVTANPSAGDDSATPGTFVLTVGALSTNEVLELSLYDNANSRSVIAVDTDLYKSNTITATVV